MMASTTDLENLAREWLGEAARIEQAEPGMTPLANTALTGRADRIRRKKNGRMDWRISSYSYANGNCAEIGSRRKSTSGNPNGECAEAGQGDGVIGVRDTKQAHLGAARAVLEFPPGAWRDFIARIRDDTAVSG